jgi:hypothetical protein
MNYCTVICFSTWEMLLKWEDVMGLQAEKCYPSRNQSVSHLENLCHLGGVYQLMGFQVGMCFPLWKLSQFRKVFMLGSVSVFQFRSSFQLGSISYVESVSHLGSISQFRNDSKFGSVS